MIRAGKKRDAEYCLNLTKLDGMEYWNLEDFENAAENDDVIFLVYEDDGEIIAYILGFILPTKETEAMIHETRVHKERRGEGIGTEIVDAFCDRAFEMGADVVIAEIDEELLNFYRDACNFEEGGKWVEVRKGSDPSD